MLKSADFCKTQSLQIQWQRVLNGINEMQFLRQSQEGRVKEGVTGGETKPTWKVMRADTLGFSFKRWASRSGPQN